MNRSNVRPGSHVPTGTATVQAVRPLGWAHHLPPGTTLDRADLVARGSLPAVWARVWAGDGRRPTVLDVGAGSGARWVSAAALEELTRAAAQRLLASGAAPGARVLVCLPTSLAAVVTYVAVLRTGTLVGVPVNPAYTARELAHIVHDVRPALAVVEGGWRVDAVTAASSGATAVVAVDPGGEPTALFSSGPVAAGVAAGGRPADVALDGARGGDVALIAYTSGTTGSPKGAMLSHANLLANSESIARTWRWEGSDRLVHALPVFHGHGLCVALFTSLLTGSSIALLPRFDVDAVLDAAARHDATMFFGVPTMYHRLAASSRAGELSRLRLAVSGSAALRPELHEALRATGTVVLERYGMTETLMTLSNPYDGERRAGTVGFPFPGVDAEVEGADRDGTDRAGAGAEVRVQGPAVFSGYWERPAATADCFDGPWFRTGDLGVVEDGYVRLLGRSSEVVISGGYNVYPAEVEDVLLGHPSVAEVAVTGTASDEWGETVTAWVVTDGESGVDPSELQAFAAERLAPYKRPRQFHVVDALPRNPMGKVRKSELR